MDFKSLLSQLDQLNEATEKTKTGVKHTAEPGGYGRKDDEDEEGNKVKPASTEKRGKGRPKKATSTSGEDKKYDFSAFGATGKDVKLPKYDKQKTTKHSLKEYFDLMDEALQEAALAVQPMPATPQQQQQQAVATKPSFMIKDPANPSMPAITTQDPAVVQAAKNGTMSMQKPGAAPTAPGATPAAGAGSQVAPMAEEGEKWIQGAIKHPGAFTKKAKAHGMTPAQFRAKVLAHKEDYPAKTEKQAQLAKTLSKMHESQGESPYTLELISSEERDDPEGWSTMKVGTFKVLKNGKEIGTAEWDDYFGNLEIDINGKRQQLKYDSNHPLLKMAKHAVEEPINIAQRAHHGVKEADSPQYFAQASPVGSSNNRSDIALEGKKGVNPFVKKDDKAEKIGKKVTKDLEKNAKPDFLDIDKDGNKKEPMKQAVKDKKKVKEGMDTKLQSARLRGKSHALAKEAYNCHYDDMEEARCYHDGFKEGLDECYGQMPILGRTRVGEMGQGPEVATMASYGADDMGMDEGNAFTAGLAKTPQGSKFKVGGNTFTDRTRYDSPLDEFAFESLSSQLNSLLESETKVSEGMTVSISKGQQGSPDSVSVSAQDGEADQLLSVIKSAGLGLFGGEDKGFNAPEGSAGAHGGISVVDDHDGMMALMKKLSGVSSGETSSDGYADEEGNTEQDEEGHEHEESVCSECGGMYEDNHQCASDEVVDEVQTPDQETEMVGEANPPDSGAAETAADDASEAGEDAALATDDAAQDAETAEVYSSPTNEDEEDDEDHTCKKCDCDPCKCETMAESSFFNLYKKLAMLSEESTSEKDDKAERAAKKVAKDIEYDEGHKGKDDNKAEKAGKKVKKDIEYDDKKDKKEKKLDEWANDAGPGKSVSDTTFETDIDFMMNVISGGLNKRKSTGQTTIPVLANQVNRSVSSGTTDISESKMLNESVNDWKRLAGIVSK